MLLNINKNSDLGFLQNIPNDENYDDGLEQGTIQVAIKIDEDEYKNRTEKKKEQVGGNNPQYQDIDHGDILLRKKDFEHGNESHISIVGASINGSDMKNTTSLIEFYDQYNFIGFSRGNIKNKRLDGVNDEKKGVAVVGGTYNVVCGDYVRTGDILIWGLSEKFDKKKFKELDKQLKFRVLPYDSDRTFTFTELVRINRSNFKVDSNNNVNDLSPLQIENKKNDSKVNIVKKTAMIQMQSLKVLFSLFESLNDVAEEVNIFDELTDEEKRTILTEEELKNLESPPVKKKLDRGRYEKRKKKLFKSKQKIIKNMVESNETIELTKEEKELENSDAEQKTSKEKVEKFNDKFKMIIDVLLSDNDWMDEKIDFGKEKYETHKNAGSQYQNLIATNLDNITESAKSLIEMKNKRICGKALSGGKPEDKIVIMMNNKLL